MMNTTTEPTGTNFVEFRLPLGAVGILYNTGHFPVEISFDGETIHKKLDPGREFTTKDLQQHFHVRCSEPGERCPIYFRVQC